MKKLVRTYSLEWLDSLISVTLNPERPYRQKLTDQDILLLLEKIPTESLQVRAELTAQVFALNKESQVRHLVLKYHRALLNLRDTIATYQSSPVPPLHTLTEIETLLGQCIAELVDFVQLRFAEYFHPQHPVIAGPTSPGQGKVEHTDKSKVLCTLSADQIALLLRGADESQVLKARSMNAVFKLIIPFLSTPHKLHLSAAAVRSKAYNPEEADRTAAIEALQKIIKKIEGY